jgi:predicted nucleic acid-binding protein
VSLSETDYVNIIRHLASVGIVGGATYDALIVYVAMKIEIDQVLTLNARDFRRVYPGLANKMVEP